MNLNSFSTTCTNPIIHLFYPPPPKKKKFCIIIVFSFSWDMKRNLKGVVWDLYKKRIVALINFNVHRNRNKVLCGPVEKHHFP